MSAVTPAPELWSNPAMLITSSGNIFRKRESASDGFSQMYPSKATPSKPAFRQAVTLSGVIPPRATTGTGTVFNFSFNKFRSNAVLYPGLDILSNTGLRNT